MNPIDLPFPHYTTEMSDLLPPAGQINGGGGPSVVAPTENVGTKRQRRPSVRLGDIGDQAYDLHANRRPKQQWKLQIKDSGKGSKTRPLTNLALETLDGDEREGNLDAVAVGSWRVKDSKSKRGFTKRVRSTWAPKLDEGGGGGSCEEREDVEEEFREFDLESPMKEQSPLQIHSLDNNLADEEDDENRGNFHGNRKGDFARVSDGVELEGPSDSGARNWNNSGDRNGVRVWLNQLGLGRYAPVFEIHEVDDEVLPLLTLEDLKDMGINAVGSRRKMYCAIQKLSKGFS